MDEQLLFLENPLLKILLLENERSEWVNSIFGEREECGEFHTLFPRLQEQSLKFFEYFRMQPDTFWYLINGIRPHIEKQNNFRICISPEDRLAVTLSVGVIKMYKSLTTGNCLPANNPLQRQLADSIVKMVPLDDIRILLATGAKVNEPVTQGLRPLHYAVWQRYPEAARLLLVRGGDVNARDECGYSALHLSAEHGYIELVAMLLRQGARVDYREDTDDPFPRTLLCDEPLRLAIRNRHLEIARMLLEHGANPNKRYFFGSEINLVSPLDFEFLNLLLMFGADPNTRDRSGLTPLMKAVRLPQAMKSVLLLLQYGADVNAMTDIRHDYRTVLHYAILSGNLEIVNLLVKQGARLNYSAEYQKPTALDLAILRGDPEIVKMLIGAGANVNSSSPIIGTPLHVAVADNVPNRIELMTLLLTAGANPNLVIDTDGGPPLRPVLAEYIASIDQPSTTVVKLLLRFGAKVIMKTQFRDPLGILNSLQNISRNPEIFDLLLEAAESFDMCMIRRNQFITNEQKSRLLMIAMTPLSLLHQCRLALRRYLATELGLAIQVFELPVTLQMYLNYDY